MASPSSSRSSSPVRYPSCDPTPPEFDYLNSLAKHSGHDALARSPSPSAGAFNSLPPYSPPIVADRSKHSVKRTYSGLEAGIPIPKHRSSVFSTLLNLGATYSPLLSAGRLQSHISPSDLQTSHFHSPLVHLRKVAGHTDCSGLKDCEEGSAPDKCQQKRQVIVENLEDLHKRRKFILRLAKALLSFGAPSHRIESQLIAASLILDARAAFVHIPSIIIVSFGDGEEASYQTHFVRAGGRIALTSLARVHDIYRDVLHDKIGAEAGTEALKKLLHAAPIYPLITRCTLAFVCASIICVLGFGGALVDMFIAGGCASFLQYLGLNAAAKSSMYANVYEISVSIIVSFIARGLSSVPGSLFCYSAVSSAGVVLILPGFTVLMAALEITSRNILCGSVRMVYAIIYTLFLGFGLTLGSDLYLAIDPRARHVYETAGRATVPRNLTLHHGIFTAVNGTSPLVPIPASFGFISGTNFEMQHNIKGCFRDPAWPWWRQPVPWWSLLFLVPLYSTSSSLQNLQTYRSPQLPVMVLFSCCAYAANKGANFALPGRSDIVSAAGALVIGTLGNVYSRVARGTAFTSMVTGVLFLVPSALAQGGGLTPSYRSSTEQYSTGFALALRMIQVAIGVTIGLFVSQIFVYAIGTRKNAAHFAF